ncbi:hypothetical protein BH10PSE19_BH10PSE19_14700 [soil metagenome]
MINPAIPSHIDTIHKHTHCISWNAIVAAALVAIGLNFLLYIFTTGVGLSAFTLNSNGQLTLMVGGLIWLVIASYFIMFLVGWIAATHAKHRILHRCTGALHGFTAWSLALVITVVLFSSGVSNTVGIPVFTQYGYNNVATTAAATAAQATGSVVGNTVPPSNPVEAKTVANKTGLGILALFFIFLSSALGSICGGYTATKSICCGEKDRPIPVRRTTL